MPKPKATPEIGLRHGQETLGEGIAGGKKERRNTGRRSNQLRSGSTREPHKPRAREKQQRFPDRYPAGSQRTVAGARHVRVEIAVGQIVDHAAGRTHQHRPEHEDPRPPASPAGPAPTATTPTASARAAAGCRSACRGASAVRKGRAARAVAAHLHDRHSTASPALSALPSPAGGSMPWCYGKPGPCWRKVTAAERQPAITDSASR
jgi:hypothetical protein